MRYRHSFNGILIGTYIRPTQQCHFEWPWVILSDFRWHEAARGLFATAELPALSQHWHACERSIRARKPTQLNDASARSPNLTSACDLDLWPPDPKSWSFYPISPYTTSANFTAEFAHSFSRYTCIVANIHISCSQTNRAYSKRAVQPICAVQDAICAVQNEKLCSPKTQSWRHRCAVL